MDALRLLPPFSVNGWAWIYNSAATIHQGARKGTDYIVLKTKLSFNWIGPFKILAVGPAPASAAPDGRPLHDKLLYVDLSSDIPGRDSKSRVSNLRCKPCRNPDDIHDIPKASSGQPHEVRTQLLLLRPSTSPSTTSLHRRNGSRSPRSWDINSFAAGKAFSRTHWSGLLSLSWEHEQDLQHHRLHILRCWSGTPSQHR